MFTIYILDRMLLLDKVFPIHPKLGKLTDQSIVRELGRRFQHNLKTQTIHLDEALKLCTIIWSKKE